MKFLLSVFALLLSLSLSAQKAVPSVQIKTIQGQTFDTRSLAQAGQITVVSFWATWCAPCKKELDAIRDYYPEWKEKYKMRLVAISIDDARTAAKIPAMVEEKEWEYDVLLDANKAFHQAVNATSVPHTLIIDQEGNIVYEHPGYNPGDEVELEKKIRNLFK